MYVCKHKFKFNLLNIISQKETRSIFKLKLILMSILSPHYALTIKNGSKHSNGDQNETAFKCNAELKKKNSINKAQCENVTLCSQFFFL